MHSNLHQGTNEDRKFVLLKTSSNLKKKIKYSVNRVQKLASEKQLQNMLNKISHLVQAMILEE